LQVIESGEIDDAALVARALADRNAFALLVARYEGPLERFIRRLLGRYGQAAADVLQEAFIKAYVNLNAYDRSRPFAPWLYGIARNEALTYLRRRKAEPQVIDGEDGLLLLSRLIGAGDPQQSMAAAGVQRLIRASLEGIGARYREVLVLRFLEERSYDDIADILKLPPGTVATQIRRGLARLKLSLEEVGLGLGQWER
jgi:RNA polymerase sigma-70 factor, ECF subfamily